MPLPLTIPTPPSVEEIIARYVALWLPVSQSGTVNSAQDQSSRSKVKRPSNSWVLFRTEYAKLEEVKNHGYTSREISNVAALVWRGLSQTEKAKWHILAQALKDKHAEIFPSYKYLVRSSFEEATRPASPIHSTVMAASGSFSKRAKQRTGLVWVALCHMSAKAADCFPFLQKTSRVRGVSTLSNISPTPTSTSENSNSSAAFELAGSNYSPPFIPHGDGVSFMDTFSVAQLATSEVAGSFQTPCTFEPDPYFVSLAASGTDAILRFLDEDADVLAGLRPRVAA